MSTPEKAEPFALTPKTTPEPGDPFPCPKCGATVDEEDGDSVWTALYYQPAYQTVNLVVGANGEPEEGEYGGDEEIGADATENDALHCGACGFEITLAVVRWFEPTAMPAVDHATEIVAMLRSMVVEYDGAGCEHLEGECPMFEARALLAKLDTKKEATA